MRSLHFAVLLVCLLYSVASLHATAQTSPPTPKHIILLVVPGLTEADLRAMSEDLDAMLGSAAIGWMNCRTARIPGQKGDPYAAACLTLGSGARATAGDWAETPGPQTWERIQRENTTLDHLVPIGALGETAHLAGARTFLVGATDDTRERSPERLIIAATTGLVDLDQSRPLWIWGARDPSYPFGITCLGNVLFQPDYAFVAGDRILSFDQYDALRDLPGRLVTVAVYGDMLRCERYQELCTPDVAKEIRGRVLSSLASFGRIVERFGNKKSIDRKLLSTPTPYTDQLPTDGLLVILLSPAPAPSADSVDRLAPIAIWGGGFKPGLLISATTRTPGLVSNTDLVPTVAKFLGIEPPAGVTGRPMTSVSLPPQGNFLQRIVRKLQGVAEPKTLPTASHWADMHADWLTQSKLQRIFGGLPGFQAGLLALAIVVGLANWKRASEARAAVAGVLAVLPLAQLWLPVVSNQVIPGVSLAVICLAMTVWLCWHNPKNMTKIVVVACAALCATIALDLISGANLLRQAWMSYSVMEGARYYGIGNEYGGALMAAGLVCGAVWVSRRARKQAASPDLPQFTLLLWLAVLVGLPSFGADAGGLLSLGIGFGAALLVWRVGRLQAKHIVALFIAAVIVLLGVATLDAMRGAGASHIGRGLSSGALQIALRKASLNFYLLTHSPWALTLLAGVASLVWTTKSWAGTPEPPEGNALALRGYMAGLIVGGITLLVLNDSGVVAAAQALSLGWAGLIAINHTIDQRSLDNTRRYPITTTEGAEG